MKLYTEEDMKKAFWEGHIYAASIVPSSIGEQDKYIQNTIDSLTPIELPSDEEIKDAAPYVPQDSHDYYYGEREGFKDGAKWMKEQILNKNK
jgi:hypothetical protein